MSSRYDVSSSPSGATTARARLQTTRNVQTAPTSSAPNNQGEFNQELKRARRTGLNTTYLIHKLATRIQEKVKHDGENFGLGETSSAALSQPVAEQRSRDMLRTKSGSLLKAPRNFRSLQNMARLTSTTASLIDVLYKEVKKDNKAKKKAKEAAIHADETTLYIPNVLPDKEIIKKRVFENQEQHILFVESLAKELDELAIKNSKKQDILVTLNDRLKEETVAPELETRDTLEERLNDLSKRVAKAETMADQAEFRSSELSVMRKRCQLSLDGRQVKIDEIGEIYRREENAQRSAWLEHAAAVQELDARRFEVFKAEEDLALQRVVNQLEMDALKRIRKSNQKLDEDNARWERRRKENDPSLTQLKREKKKASRMEKRETTAIIKEAVQHSNESYWQDIFERLQEVSGVETMEEAVEVFSSKEGSITQLKDQAERSKDKIVRLRHQYAQLSEEAQEIRMMGARMTRALDKLDEPMKKQKTKMEVRQQILDRSENRMYSAFNALQSFCDFLPTSVVDRPSAVRERLSVSVSKLREHEKETAIRGEKLSRQRQLEFDVKEGLALPAHVAELDKLGNVVVVNNAALESVSDEAATTVAGAMDQLLSKLGALVDVIGAAATTKSVPKIDLTAVPDAGSAERPDTSGSAVRFASTSGEGGGAEGGAAEATEATDATEATAATDVPAEAVEAAAAAAAIEAPAEVASAGRRSRRMTITASSISAADVPVTREDVQRVALKLRMEDPNNNRVVIQSRGSTRQSDTSSLGHLKSIMSRPQTSEQENVDDEAAIPTLGNPKKIVLARHDQVHHRANNAPSDGITHTSFSSLTMSTTPTLDDDELSVSGLTELTADERATMKLENGRFQKAAELRALRGDPPAKKPPKVGLRFNVLQETENQAARREVITAEQEIKQRVADLAGDEGMSYHAYGGPVAHKVGSHKRSDGRRQDD